MAKDRVERQLEHLKSLRVAGATDASLKEMRKALADSVNVIVAKAANIADEWQARLLMPEMTAAFNRLFQKAAESDPQCWGKNALSMALKNLGCSESAIFLRGLRHRQWESTWGGKTDTAGVLRGTCALSLVQCTDIARDGILEHLVDAVSEPEARVRTDAARALEQMGGRDVGLLLRLKARAGDEEVRVTGQVLESVLQMEGAAGVPFVAEFLRHTSEEVNEEAALALGVSRLPEALEVLLAECAKLQSSRAGPTVLRAISASRLDQALEFLITQVKTARLPVAQDALRALELHRDSEDIVKRIQDAVSGREEVRVIV